MEALRKTFPSAFAAYSEIERDYAARQQALSLSTTPLSIGVIGQVKAGKSTFLNALLFGGVEVLPQAATPKTAALTRIRYGTQLGLHVQFHSPQAWEQLLASAARAAHDDVSRAAHELVAQAQARQTPLADCLAAGERYFPCASAAELRALLDDYVGAEGRFTPVVASCDIVWQHPALEGVEIVDTPGVNDPSASRVQKTRDYLAQCDAVFFLSRASQFLDEQDVALFAEQAPAKGVKRLYLVASQLDAALLDDGFERASLAETLTNVRQRLARQAQRGLAPYRERLLAIGRSALADLLQTAAQSPWLLSSFAFSFASRPSDAWSESERHTYQQLQELASDIWDEPLPEAEQWRQISGFDALAAQFAQLRADKENILAAQRASLASDYALRRRAWAEQTLVLVQERLTLLIHGEDATRLQARNAALSAQVQHLADLLAIEAQNVAWETRDECQRLQRELHEAAIQATQLQERTGYETRVVSVRVSDSVWWNPFSWGSYHYESSTRTVSYRYLAVSDAVEQVLDYVHTAQQQLAESIGRLAAPQMLAARLRNAALQALDPSDERFDPIALRALITQSLASLPLPQWDFALPDPSAPILQRFAQAGELRNEGEMAALRAVLAECTQATNQALAQALAQRVDGWAAQVKQLTTQLHQHLSQAVAAELAQLAQQLQDREANIQHCQQLLTELQTLT